MIGETILIIWLLGLALLGIIFIIMVSFFKFNEEILFGSLLFVLMMCIIFSIYIRDFVKTEKFYSTEYDIEQMAEDYDAVIKYVEYTDTHNEYYDYVEHNQLLGREEWIYYKYQYKTNNYDKYKLTTEETTEKGE